MRTPGSGDFPEKVDAFGTCDPHIDNASAQLAEVAVQQGYAVDLRCLAVGAPVPGTVFVGSADEHAPDRTDMRVEVLRGDGLLDGHERVAAIGCDVGIDF